MCVEGKPAVGIGWDGPIRTVARMGGQNLKNCLPTFSVH